METLTIQKIEFSNLLFEQYLKRALSWDESREFAPNGLTKKDFDDETKAYGLYSEDYFVGFSLVKTDSRGNVVSFKRVVDSLKNKDQQLSEYIDKNMKTVAEEEIVKNNQQYVKKMRRN